MGSYNQHVRPTIVFSGVCFMFGPIGMPELIIILTLALIIFGPRKLPELGRSLGKSLGEFKRASNELRNTLDEEIRIEEERSTQRSAKPETAPPAAASPDYAPHAQDYAPPAEDYDRADDERRGDTGPRRSGHPQRPMAPVPT